MSEHTHNDHAEDLAEMPAVIHEEGAAAFFDSKGGKCPVCGGDQIEGDKTDFDGDHVYQRQWCPACGKGWSAAYRLCNIYDPDHDRTFEAPLPEAVKLRKALETCRAALYNTPGVGEEYDEQHTICHTAALMEIGEALGDRNTEGSVI